MLQYNNPQYFVTHIYVTIYPVKILCAMKPYSTIRYVAINYVTDTVNVSYVMIHYATVY